MTVKFDRILVPVDYSSCSRSALRCAIELASRLHATLDVVHVWDRPSYVTEAMMTTTEAVSGKSLVNMIEQNARRDLDDFLGGCELPEGVVLGARLLSGHPTSVLVHELKRGEHDAVVLGTHGRTGLSRALLGSVAEKLVRLSPVPVLTVPDVAAQQQRR